jgi:hypothetical protein
VARTCCDHAVGRLGVAVFAALVERGALLQPEAAEGPLTMGPETSPLTGLGIDPDALGHGRRNLAVACLDSAHRLPHRGASSDRRYWTPWSTGGLVTRRRGSREPTVADRGASELPALFTGFAPAAVTGC